MYFAFLFFHMDKLPPNIEKEQIYLLGIYVVSDWLLLLFSWRIQSRIIERRDYLFKCKANCVSAEKKADDMFDIRYLPEEYLSDV